MQPRVGEQLPPLELPPLTRASLALYAGGSGDYIPLHIDSDFAKAAGYPDQFMHGMLGVAYITRMITTWAPQERLRAISVRFSSITYPGEALTARATVTRVAIDGEVELEVTLRNSAADTKIAGRAIVELLTPVTTPE